MAKMLMLMLMLIRGAFSSHVLLFIKQRQDGVEERAEEDDQERRDQRAPHAAAFLQRRDFHDDALADVAGEEWRAGARCATHFRAAPIPRNRFSTDLIV